MTKFEAQSLLNNWWTNYEKMFEYYEAPFKYDFVQIKKLESNEDGILKLLYEVNDKSTRKPLGLKLLNEDQMIKLLEKEELIYYDGWNNHTDPKELKTGGCHCGAYATRDPDCHSYWCPKYLK